MMEHMPNKNCIICSSPFNVPLCREKTKTCGMPECTYQSRRLSAKKLIEEIGHPTTRDGVRGKIAGKMREAYKNGRMDHMKKVWSDASDRWTAAGNPKYKDGNANGYIMVKTADGWRPLHRVKMERKIGRPLLQNEVVHHKNGDKHDNRIKNLQLLSASEHMKIHRNK